MKLLLFGAHRWGREECLKLFGQWGYKVLLFASENEVIPDNIEQTETIYRFVQGDALSIKQLANQLKSSTNSEAHIMAMDEYQLEEAALLAQYLMLPFLPPQSAIITFNKHLTRQMWHVYTESNTQLDLKKVAFACFEGIKENIDPKEKSQGWDKVVDVIIKPDAYSGSVGLTETTEEGIINAVKHLSILLQKEAQRPEMKGIAFPKTIIAEEKISRNPKVGFHAEFSAHAISKQGKVSLFGFSEKILGNDFLELGHIFPAQHIPNTFLKLAEKVIADLLQQLKVINSISNWEFIITDDNKLALVEVQLRPAGDNLMTIIERSIGKHPFRFLLDNDLTVESSQLCGIFWLAPHISMNKIERISYENNKAIYINETELLADKNWIGPSNWYNRYAYVMVNANSFSALTQQAEKLANSIEISGTANGKALTTHLTLAADRLARPYII